MDVLPQANRAVQPDLALGHAREVVRALGRDLALALLDDRQLAQVLDQVRSCPWLGQDRGRRSFDDDRCVLRPPPEGSASTYPSTRTVW